jgi:hypothetical protein
MTGKTSCRLFFGLLIVFMLMVLTERAPALLAVIFSSVVAWSALLSKLVLGKSLNKVGHYWVSLAPCLGSRQEQGRSPTVSSHLLDSRPQGSHKRS